MPVAPLGHSCPQSLVHLLVHSLGTRHSANGRGYIERAVGIVLCLWSEHDVGRDKSADRCNEKGQALHREGQGELMGKGGRKISLRMGHLS